MAWEVYRIVTPSADSTRTLHEPIDRFQDRDTAKIARLVLQMGDQQFTYGIRSIEAGSTED